MAPQFDNVLVFGATGDVGAVTALEASARGAKVWLGMRDVKKENKWLSIAEEQQNNMTRIYGDLTVPSSLTSAIRESGAKAVYIYAIPGGDFMRASITALKEAGVQYIVLLSSVSVRAPGKNGNLKAITPDDFIPYYHAQVEIVLDDLDIPHAAIRPGFFSSNPLRLLADLSTTPPSAHLLGIDDPMDCIDPRDIGRTSAAILVNPRIDVSPSKTGPRKDPIFLLGPKVYTIREQYEIINRSLAAQGKPLIDVKVVSVQEFIDEKTKQHLPKPLIDSLVTNFSKESDEMFSESDLAADRPNVKKITGQEPTNFEDFVKRDLGKYL